MRRSNPSRFESGLGHHGQVIRHDPFLTRRRVQRGNQPLTSPGSMELSRVIAGTGDHKILKEEVIILPDSIVVLLGLVLVVLLPIAIIGTKKRYLWTLRCNDQVDLAFDQFLSFWRVNQENWILGESWLEYRRNAREDCDIVKRCFSIRLPYKDVPRYKKFVANKREQDELAKRNKITTDFIRYVQEDLNKLAAQSPIFDVKNSENPMDAIKTSPLPRGFE